MTEKEKMILGIPYRDADSELIALRKTARIALGAFNHSDRLSRDEQQDLLQRLLGTVGEESFIQPPFYCDYGFNIHVGKKFYMNFNGVILDVSPVSIGDCVMCGPNVQILAATHDLDPEIRNYSGTELGKPISIGNEVWIGGGVIICPGVTIGNQAVIGAGSVVTRDVPARVFAAGNPCRVIKEIK